MLRMAAALVIVASLAAPAQAELRQAAPDGFVVEHRFTIQATPAAAWEVLVHPERWWPSDHSWSGDAANMSLEPVAGGCFCERWDGGSAEHGRVIMVQSGRILRFRGALGPMQDMALTGIMQVTLEAVDGGTRATVVYRISGDASHGLDKFATVVDQVVGQQYGAFATLASKPAQ